MTKHGTGIEWTHIPGFKGETWNPIVGCSVISPGCTNCYAMSMAARLEKMKLQQYMGTTVPSKAGPVWTGRLNIASEQVLTKPLRWSKPRAIFVNSMGDLFHEDVLEDWVARVFAIMALCPQHIFIVLTKRSERMRSLLSEKSDGWLLGDSSRPGTLCHEIYSAGFKVQRKLFPNRTPAEKGHELDRKWPLPNVWLGVSVEDQRRAEQRIPDLLATPAEKRILSCEPLLGPVDLTSICNGHFFQSALNGSAWHEGPGLNKFEQDHSAAVDWVIVGGESGPGARPMHADWARSIRDQCAQSGLPFFFKQWGNFLPWSQYEWSNVPVETDVANSSYETMILHSDGWWDAGYADWMMAQQYEDGGANFMSKVGKRKAGHILDGQEHFNWPEVSS
jgi:protein gp37